jgi:hypothetical protein
VIELPRLLSAAEHVVEEKDTDEDLRLLFCARLIPRWGATEGLGAG